MKTPTEITVEMYTHFILKGFALETHNNRQCKSEKGRYQYLVRTSTGINNRYQYA